MASSYNTSQSIRWIYLTENFNINNLDLYGQTLEDESQLQKPLGFIKFCMNVHECVDYISNVQNSHIILTISGRFARDVTPQIHDFPQLAAVYIHCKPENKQRNKEWSTNYHKVKAIFSEIEEYTTMIYQNHIKSYVQKENSSISVHTSRVRLYGTTSFNVFDSTASTYKDLSAENGNFVWMQLLVEVLLHMDSSKSPIDELHRMCDEFIHRDNKDWESVFVFVGVYNSSNPIKWYTKKPFIYQFVNEILRSGDIDKLIVLRMLVRDINNQLEEEHRKFVEPHITVYRGQAMKLVELKYLQKHIKHFISMNSFLSTSRDRDMALMYANCIDTSDPSLKSILFEIDCDTCRLDTKPFADISHLSCFEGEKEILFMLGSVFRVDDVYENQTNNVWVIKMTLCGKTDYDFGNLFQSIRNDVGEIPTLTSLGLLFQYMGDFKRATKCFQQHLDLLEGEDATIRPVSYQNLGNMARENGDYDTALDHLHKSLTIRLSSSSNEKIDMGSLYNDIGLAYGANKDYKRALEYYEKALSYILESVGENHTLSAMIYGNIGETYLNDNKHDLALNNLNKSLQIQKNLNRENHPEFAKTLASIGTAYCAKNEHTTAISYMEKAVDKQQNMLPNNHVSLAISYNNIGLAYARNGIFDLALENLNRAQRIFQVALPIDHPDTQAVTNNIKLMKAILEKR